MWWFFCFIHSNIIFVSRGGFVFCHSWDVRKTSSKMFEEAGWIRWFRLGDHTLEFCLCCLCSWWQRSLRTCSNFYTKGLSSYPYPLGKGEIWAWRVGSTSANHTSVHWHRNIQAFMVHSGESHRLCCIFELGGCQGSCENICVAGLPTRLVAWHTWHCRGWPGIDHYQTEWGLHPEWKFIWVFASLKKPQRAQQASPERLEHFKAFQRCFCQ